MQKKKKTPKNACNKIQHPFMINSEKGTFLTWEKVYTKTYKWTSYVMVRCHFLTGHRTTGSSEKKWKSTEKRRKKLLTENLFSKQKKIKTTPWLPHAPAPCLPGRPQCHQYTPDKLGKGTLQLHPALSTGASCSGACGTTTFEKNLALCRNWRYTILFQAHKH